MEADYKTEVVRVETDTSGDYEVKITVRRHRANEFYSDTPPYPDDVPQDIRAALVSWIGEI